MTESVDIRASAGASPAPVPSPATVGASGRRLFGHPAGLWYLAFTEAWERFSYYGMQTLLVLYMVGQLLQPGHIENVAGFASFRAALEAVYGPLSIQALASAVFGIYTGLVYLTPVAGGLVADRWLGRTRTILLGGTLMTIGHFLMAFDVSFLGALLCLAIGTGCFKGNIAVQVGGLYAPEDNARADAFQIFYLGISAGVIASPLVCGTLGEVYGWHYGFAAAGIGMAVGLAIYIAGARHLPAEPRIVVRRQQERPRLSAADWRVLALLLAMLPVLALALLGNQQIFNAYMIWAQASYDFTLFGRTMPTSWLITFDAAASVVMLALTVLFWRLWSRRFAEPVEITKLVIGAGVTVVAFLLLTAAAQSAGGGKINLWWAVAFHIINSIGFAHLVPVALALYVRMAPQVIGATIVGVFYLHLFMANNLVGWVGTRLETMSADRFWLLHAVVVGVSGLILLAMRVPVKRALAKAAEAASDRADRRRSGRPQAPARADRGQGMAPYGEQRVHRRNVVAGKRPMSPTMTSHGAAECEALHAAPDDAAREALIARASARRRGSKLHLGGAVMTPNFKLTSLAIDPLEWRACASFADEEVVLTARFPFRPEYDMPFGEVREQAERRALELLGCVSRPPAD